MRERCVVERESHNPLLNQKDLLASDSLLASLRPLRNPLTALLVTVLQLLDSSMPGFVCIRLCWLGKRNILLDKSCFYGKIFL